MAYPSILLAANTGTPRPPPSADLGAPSWLLQACCTLAECCREDDLARTLLHTCVQKFSDCATLDLLEAGSWRRWHAGHQPSLATWREIPSPLTQGKWPHLAELLAHAQGVSSWDLKAHDKPGQKKAKAAPPNNFVELLGRLGQGVAPKKQKGQGARAVLAVPVRGGGQLLGVVTLQRPTSLGPWSTDQRRQVQLVTLNAAMAVSAIRLHRTAIQERQGSDRQRRRLAFGFGFSDALAAASTLGEVLRTLAQGAVQELARAVIVHLEGSEHGRQVVVAHVDAAKAERLQARLGKRPKTLRALQRDQDRASGKDVRMVLPLTIRGEVRGHVLFVRPRGGADFDADDRTMAEAMLRRTGQTIHRTWLAGELQQAVRVRDEFVSIASHELRTPLAALQLQLGSLRRQVDKAVPTQLDARRVGDKTDRALHQTARLCQLIDNLLNVSRMGARALTLRKKGTDLTALCQRLVALHADEARRCGSTLQLRAPGPLRGHWDATQLGEAVGHLLANAIKYGEKKPVVLRLSRREGGVLLRVLDHGIGLGPRALPRIFDCFERAVSARAFGGLGVGLFLARQIVLAHGGRIRARSSQQAGTQFEVWLPYSQGPSAALGTSTGRAQL